MHPYPPKAFQWYQECRGGYYGLVDLNLTNKTKKQLFLISQSYDSQRYASILHVKHVNQHVPCFKVGSFLNPSFKVLCFEVLKHGVHLCPSS
jgi:hypothetical protein